MPPERATNTMNTEPPVLTMAVLLAGLTAFALLTLIAVRRGKQIQGTWQKLAVARGWRYEQTTEPGVDIRLLGRTQDMAWSCSLVHAPVVNTPQTIGKSRPLETLWRTQLPDESLDGHLNLYDAVSFRRLRRAVDSPLMDVMAHVSPGLAGKALAAGITAARASATPIGANHMAIGTENAIQRLIDREREMAFQCFVRENADPPLRIFIDAHQIEIALLGAIKDAGQLERFIASCVRLAEATRQRRHG